MFKKGVLLVKVLLAPVTPSAKPPLTDAPNCKPMPWSLLNVLSAVRVTAPVATPTVVLWLL